MSSPETHIPPVVRVRAKPDTIAPDGSQIRLLMDASTAGGGPAPTRASLCEVTLPAGQVSRPVWHRTVEEIWYVLSGQGEVWRCPPPASKPTSSPPSPPSSAPAATASLRPEEAPAVPTVPTVPAVAVGPGDALFIPTGWRFQFRAGASAPLRFLCYTSPPWPGSDEAQPAERGGLGAPTVPPDEPQGVSESVRKTP